MFGLLRGRYGTGDCKLSQSAAGRLWEVVRRALCVWLRVYRRVVDIAPGPQTSVHRDTSATENLILGGGVLEGSSEARIDSCDSVAAFGRAQKLSFGIRRGARQLATPLRCEVKHGV